MSKSAVTLQLEQEIYKRMQKRGVFCCFEVTIGWYGKERVDFLTYDTKGVFRCFEVKSSVSDFHSKAKKTFIGHFNYYVLTQELYEKVESEIPADIGVYVGGVCVRRSKKRELSQHTTHLLKDSMIRSLYRYFEEVQYSSDISILKQKDRKISRLEYDKNRYYKELVKIKQEKRR